MQTEAQCSPSARFLLADVLFTDHGIRIIQKEFIRRNQGRQVTAAYEEFASWTVQPNQVMLFTWHAYADLALPKAFDCLFNYDEPAQYTRVSCELIHCLWEGWFPLGSVEHGHKHIGVFTFPDQMPDLLHSLYQEDGSFSSQSLHKPMIGLCNFTDFGAITSALTRRANLKEAYGGDWWKYDDSESSQ
jgi:hypothetical protein